LVKGQPVIESLLAPIGSGSGLQALVPEGMRAITVEINEFSGVGGLLQPGCHVDVIATIIDSEDNDKLARTIVENVRVISVGQRMSSKDEAEEGDRMSKSVTLIASPQDAEAIELAAATGRPRLVLRGGNDHGSAATDGVTLAELRGSPKRHIDPFTHPVMQYIPQTTPATQPTQPTNVEQPEEKPLIKASAPEPKVRYRHVQVIRNGVESNVSFVDPVTAPANNTGFITGAGSEVNN
jgi:pilus assembly protein CpaB